MRRDFDEERRCQRVCEELDKLFATYDPEGTSRRIYAQSPLGAMMFDRSPGYARRMAEYRKQFLEEQRCAGNLHYVHKEK